MSVLSSLLKRGIVLEWEDHAYEVKISLKENHIVGCFEFERFESDFDRCEYLFRYFDYRFWLWLWLERLWSLRFLFYPFFGIENVKSSIKMIGCFYSSCLIMILAIILLEEIFLRMTEFFFIILSHTHIFRIVLLYPATCLLGCVLSFFYCCFYFTMHKVDKFVAPCTERWLLPSYHFTTYDIHRIK